MCVFVLFIRATFCVSLVCLTELIFVETSMQTYSLSEEGFGYTFCVSLVCISVCSVSRKAAHGPQKNPLDFDGNPCQFTLGLVLG